MIWCASIGDVTGVTRLLGEGVDVNATDDSGYPALQLAAKGGHMEMCQMLIHEAGATIHAKKRDGYPSFYFAAEFGHLDICQLLINAGADINYIYSIGEYRETALPWAVERGKIGVCKLLIDAGTDVNATNSDGLTSLYLAASLSREDICEVLIKGGADANQKCQGDYALHKSMINKSITLCRLLLDAGADPSLKNELGNTALVYAKLYRCTEIVALLEQMMHPVHA